MSLATLRLFGAVRNTGEKQAPILLKEYGALIAPEAAYDHSNIKQYLKVNAVGIAERNSAFWESWQKVAHASDFTLLAEQIVHYISTYGLESFGVDSVGSGFVYIPKRALVDHEPVMVYLIQALTDADLIKRSFQLLNSGVALQEQTVLDLLDVLQECGYKITGDETIKNKEAQVLFYKFSGKLPTRGDTLFRYIIYAMSDQTMVINNEELRSKLTASHKAMPSLNDAQMVELSKDFNRYRPLWMAIKKAHSANHYRVNLLTRLSKKHHKPMTPNVLNNLTGTVGIPMSKVKEAAKGATLGQLVRAYNAIALRQEYPFGSVYRIRNGKLWTSEKVPLVHIYTQYKTILLEEIRRRVGRTKVYTEPFVDYGFPTSEKSFIGNFPNNTILRIPKGSYNVMVGVHWKDRYTDLDLRADNESFSLGWNTNLRNKSRGLMHSGDMTRAPAPHGATEWVYAAELAATYNLKLNLYSGPDFSKHFKLMVGISNKTPKGNTEIAPQDILFSSDMPMEDKQLNLGVLYPEGENICYLMNVASTGKRNVGRYSKFDGIQQDVFTKQLKSALRLKDVVTIVHTPAEDALDLSLNALTKDKFLFDTF